MRSLGRNLEQSEVEVIFKFMDIDGTNTIEYSEFLKKLRRAGVSIKNQDEQEIYNLYDRIRRANMTLK